ncbi:hypothetical protein EOL70_29250 [Leucothrix sargassi]|nr:hypothetical protein EOL70_29250 [Leucothrix sargassi]
MSRIYIKPIQMQQTSTNRIYYWFNIDEDAYDLSMLEKAWVNHPWPKLKNIALVGLCFNMIQNSQDFDTDISLKKLIEQVSRREIYMQWNSMFGQSFKSNLQKNRTTFQKHYSKDDFGIQLFQILMQGVGVFAECQYELEQARTLGERAKVNKLKRMIDSCDAMKLFPETTKLINSSPAAINYFDQAVLSYLPKYEFRYTNDDVILVSLSRKEKIDHANIFLAGQSLYSLNTLKSIKRNIYDKNVRLNESIATANVLPIENHSLISIQENSFSELANEDFLFIDVNRVKKVSKTVQTKDNTASSKTLKDATISQEKIVTQAVKPQTIGKVNEKTTQSSLNSSTQPSTKPAQSEPVVASKENEKLSAASSTQVEKEVKATLPQTDTANTPKNTEGDTNDKKELSIFEKAKQAKLNPALEAMFDISNWRD